MTTTTTTATSNTDTRSISARLDALSRTFAPVFARTALSVVFLISGLTKLSQYEGTQAYMSSVGVPGAFLPLVIAFEIFAPLAVILGWQARIAAFLLAGFSLVTALLFHFNFADQIQSIMFMKNIAIAGGFGLIFANGSGAFSLSRQ